MVHASDPPDDTETRIAELTGDMEQLTQLRADYEDWAFHVQDEDTVDLRWEAKRLPFRYPPGGGIGWIRAESAEALRDLLGGVLQVEHQAAAEASAATVGETPTVAPTGKTRHGGTTP